MIKTMLLTAQLALSPIVGTNGLQPKRANTDPYTEVDMSVVYNGVTYERELYGKAASIDAYATYKIGEDFTYYAQEEITNTGFTRVEQENSLLMINTAGNNQRTITSTTTDKAFCFYMQPPNWSRPKTYIEVLGQTLRVFNVAETNPTIETFVASDTLYWGAATWYFNISYQQDWPNSSWLNENRAVPEVQPTKRSETLYNTIYNFYEGTIFNGAGIAEYETSVGENTMTMQEWLSHTATIATISLLCVAVAILVIKIFKLIAGSISDIWG